MMDVEETGGDGRVEERMETEVGEDQQPVAQTPTGQELRRRMRVSRPPWSLSPWIQVQTLDYLQDALIAVPSLVERDVFVFTEPCIGLNMSQQNCI